MYKSFYSGKSAARNSLRFFIVALVISFVGSQGLFVSTAYAATYTFTQSSWAGGATTATSTHTSNQSNWTELTSTSTVTSGATVTLPLTAYGFTDDGATSTTSSLPAFGGGFANGASTAMYGFTDDVSTSTAPTIETFGGKFSNGVTTADAVVVSFTDDGLSNDGATSTTAATAVIGGGFSNGATTRTIAFTDDGATTTWPTPSNAATGGGFANGTNSSTIVVGGSASSTVRLTTTSVLGTGGIINNVGATTAHTFSDTGSFLFVPAISGNVSVLVVAGGGGGGSARGSNGGGGGGAGGIATSSSYAVTAGTAITVTVGEGGVGGAASNNGSAGSTSGFGTLSATGGGYGGAYGGGSGGSGGGGSGATDSGGSGTGVQGKAGGAGGSARGGGGGGAGAAGATGAGGSAGGNGLAYDTSGSSVTYAGGGGGGNIASAGGSGGGGAGGTDSTTGGAGMGTTNTGGGGGGGAPNVGPGGNGGSGVVIVSYPIPTSGATSGTFTSAVIDLGAASAFSSLSYVATTTATTTPTGTSISMDIRAGSTADLSAVSWTTGVANGGDISALGSYRYVQYRANLTTDKTIYTPVLESVTLNYVGAVANSISGTGASASLGLATSSTLYGSSGGTITTSGGNTIHKFTSSGTFVAPSVAFGNNISLLVVAGGGGGGTGRATYGSGGGGAGGVIYKSNFYRASNSSTAVTVGGGGSAAGNGSNSVFSSFTAVGGGTGSDYAGSNGGSGGGGYSTYAGGAGTAGQGGGGANASLQGGSGGGARGVGQRGDSTTGGTGGTGLTLTIEGSSITYGCGGGGGNSGSAGCSGAGAGGASNTIGSTADANTGGGGGGGGSNTKSGGAGGSGVVIVSYPTPATDATAGTATYTSTVLDLGAVSALSSIYVASTTSAGATSVSVNVRAGDSGDTADASWSAWTTTSTSATTTITSLGSHQYVQYKTTLTTTNPALTPTVDYVTINYSAPASNNISNGSLGLNITSSSPSVVYSPTSTFTSAVIDIATTTAVFSTLAFSTTTPAGTNITFKVRSSSDSAMSGATAFSSCTAIADDAALSTGGCVTDGHRYVQYEASLSTGDTSVTPTIDSVTINYMASATNNISGSGTGASVGLASTATSTFTASGTFTVPTGITSVSALVVAGGGGGSVGGGGGGGVVATSTYLVTPGAGVSVTIGTGGSSGGGNGGNSVFGIITAIGGGGGGGTPGASGGSGGGSGRDAGTGQGGAGTSGQGYAGGSAIAVGWASAGGGGGAGQVGFDGGTDDGNHTGTLGNGGDGVASSISGASNYYGGGGGGTWQTGSAHSAGGAGGGGAGGGQGSGAGGSGTANTGGGGGGDQSGGTAGGSGIVIVSYVASYPASGTFTSAVIDLGVASGLATLSHTKTTPANTTLTMDIRAGNTATPDGTWTSWTTGVSSGGDISALGTKRYVQYRANLSTTDTSATPTLDSVAIGHTQYTTSGNLTSSKYNTESDANLISKLTWTATGTTTTEIIKFQVRSSADGNTWSEWCGPATACDGTDYFLDANNGVALASDHPLRNGGNDQWLQYKVFMTSEGGATPALTSVTATYVVNAPPDFDATYGTNGVLPAQVSDSASANWGKVTIGYKVRDTDTTTGTVTPNAIIPSFEYSTTSGTYWATIPNGDLSLGATTTKAVEASNYTTYTAVWTASSTLPDVYKTTMQIRVTASDSEAANATASATSGIFTFDSTAPVAGNGNVVLNATTTSAFVTLTVTDNSQNQYRLCNNSAFPASDSQGNSCAWSSIATTTASTSVAWILPSSAGSEQIAYFQVRDVFGKTTSKTLTAPATPTNFIFADVSNPSASSYGEYLSWTTVSGASTYQVYYATTTGATPSASAYTLLGATANNYYTHTITNNLTAKYWYKATAVSSNSDISTLTSAQGDVPDSYGTALPDSTAPTVSAIATSSILSTSAVVTFTTDEIATSTVMYGTSQVACASYESSQSTSAYATSQSISLSGLTAATTYYFCVRAGDTTYNTSTATSTTGTGLPLAFTTVAADAVPVIFNVASTSDSSSFTVTWDVSTSSNSYINYATSTAFDIPVTVGSATILASTTNHSVTVTGRSASTGYYYSITTTDGSGNSTTDTNGGSYYGATTTAAATDDAPVVSAIATSSILSTSAVVTFTTDRIATSTVTYGTGGTCGSYTNQSSVLTSTYGTSHSVSLTGLSAATAYLFCIQTANTSDINSTATSTTGTGIPLAFTTQPAPVIFNVASTSDSSSFTVTWDVSTSSNSYINYATSTAFDIPVTVGSATILASTTNHSVTVTGRSASTGYYYSITTTDGSGNSTTDTNGGLYYGATTTAAATDDAPVVSAIATSSILSTSAVVTFTTDKIATSTVTYGTAGTCGSYTNQSSVLTSTYGTSHSVSISGLSAGTGYLFCVKTANTSAIESTATSTNDTGLPLAFTTDSAVSISSIATSSVNTTAFTVTWNTATSSDSYVYYSTSQAFTTSTSTGSATLVPATSPGVYPHSVNVTGLTANTSYYFSVKSTDSLSNTTTDTNGGSYYNVVTTSNAAPVVSAIATSSILSTSAVVTFTTDEIATSTVMYGTSQVACASYESSQSTSAYATSQSISLSGLSAGTTYYFCVKATDTSNVTSTATSTTETGIPLAFTTAAATAMPTIFNVASTSNSNSFTVTWDVSTSSNSYINYATSTAFDIPVTVGSATILASSTNHSVTVTGLDASTGYYYSITTTDGSGNSTTDTNGGLYYGATTTAAATDPAPVVSSIATSSVLSTSAVVTFTTDKIATSSVKYGTVQGVCSSYGSVASTSAYATSHSISLSSLSAATTYYFCVQAANSTGYESTATSTTGTGIPLAFTTDSAVEISSIATSSVNNTSFTVTWNTSTSSDSYVHYSTSAAFTTSTSTGSAALVSAMSPGVYPHSVNVTGLIANTSYYFSVVTTDVLGNSTTDNNSGGYYNVVTTSNAAPVISSIATSTILSSSAVVTFTTDEIATSSVLYGTTQGACSSYSSSQITSAYNTSHSITVSNLSSATTYYFCVQATDTAEVSSTATSTTGTGLALAFTTASGPNISNVQNGALTDTTAVITWDTATSSDSYVYYSESASLSNPLNTGNATSTENGNVHNHSVTLTGLTQGTAYYYYVKSTDSDANSSTDTNAGGYYTIPASRDVTAPVISNISAAVKSPTAAALVWQTDETATSQVYYGTVTGTYTKQTSRDNTKTIYHVMTLASTTLNAADGASDVAVSNNLLSANTLYYFVVVSTDTAGNTATSSESTFNTEAADTTPPTVSSIAVPAATLQSSTAAVTFTTDEIATSSVQYRISGGGAWTTTNSTAFDVSHSVALSGLTQNTTYNLQVRAGDAADNVSGYTAGSDFTTTGGPIITEITESSLTNTSVTITWLTSTSSDSYIYYATSSALTNPSTAGNATMVSASTTPDTFQHEVTLSGLEENTTYYYYVSSTDSNSDTTTSPTAAPYGSFTTTLDQTGPVITAISAPVKSAFAAVITWRTDELSSSQVMYGTVSSSTNNGVYALTTVVNTTPTIFHIVTLSSDTANTSGGTNALVKNTTYYYRVKSLDQTSNLTTSDENEFTTNEDGAIVQTTVVQITQGGGGGGGGSSASVEVDKTAPSITSVKVADVTPFGATVTFTTNEDAMGSLYYGETNNYGYNTGGLVWTKTHSIELKGLHMGTTYHIKVVANDKSGNTASSEDQTFKTDMLAQNLGDLKILDSTSPEDIQARIEDLIESALPSINPPYINTPDVVDVGEDSATIVWSTNVKSFGSVAYSEDANFSNTAPTTSTSSGQASPEQATAYTSEISESDSVKKADHTIKLTNLRPNTKYHYSIKSYVFQQAPAKTADLTFTTKASKVQAQALDRKNDSFRVVWNTDEETSSIVEYKKQGSVAADKKSDTTMTLYHDMLIDNLLPGTTYEVKVYGYNKDGNFIEAKENLIVITTRDVTPPVITSFKVDSALVPGRNDRTQTVVSWKTDEPSTSIVKYEEGSGAPDAPLSNKQEDASTLVTNHTIILTNLRPGTIYRFQIGSADAAGNSATLPVRTIITPRQTESVVDVIFKNFSDTFNFINNPR